MSAKILQGDSLAMLKTLPPDSVHCIVTSPPYWGGLRDYGVEGQLGLEATPQEHIANIVKIFREARRVLHPSGTLWFNYGDCWIDKHLMGMPWRCAMALQSEGGWYLRADIIWHKPNGKPSSVTDRPAPMHEYLFLLSKEPQYFYDQDAIREKTGNESTWEDYAAADGRYHLHEHDAERGLQQHNPNFKTLTHPLGRNKRSIWNMNTGRFSYKDVDPDYAGDDHFATFPTELPEVCIKAGTSEKGCCPECLEPWTRLYEDVTVQEDNGNRKLSDAPGATLSETSMMRTGKRRLRKPVGWATGCKCGKAPIPCTVLDVFNGAGTTGLVARRLQRSYIGIELNPKDVQMSARRIQQDAPLFNQVEVIA